MLEHDNASDRHTNADRDRDHNCDHPPNPVTVELGFLPPFHARTNEFKAAKLRQTKTPWDQQYRAALSSYIRVLMSSNEFVFLD